VGFFEVVGHGVPASVIDAMQAATAEFFALPEATKRATKPADLEVNRGYSARATEGLGYSVGVARPPDLFEAFHIGPDAPDLADPAVAAERHRLFAPNVWPAEVPALCPALTAYMAAARAVADRLTDLFAAALGLPDGFFAPFFTHSTDTLRVNHYETQPGDPDPVEGQIGMGEHTDYGVCTVLFADQVPGLQIVAPDGFDASPIEAQWDSWAKAVKLARKLRCMRQCLSRDGEAFAVLMLAAVMPETKRPTNSHAMEGAIAIRM
jgi:isopenicillin N synthase-like dioxygenase